jgi:transposase InsO family protein
MEEEKREKEQEREIGEAPAAEGGRSPSGAAGAGVPCGGAGGPGEELEHLTRFRKHKQSTSLQKKEEQVRATRFTPGQRLLILDTWRRSGLTTRDFSAIVGLSHNTLYGWKRRFNEWGPEGLTDAPRKPRTYGVLNDITKRAIIMLKESHPEYGCQRISDMLMRGPGMGASTGSVSKVLHEAGYEMQEESTHPHRTAESPKRFERSRANEMWQTDIFVFSLKRQNRRVYLTAFMDDHSRYIVSYALQASQSNALVLEALRSGIASYQAPREVLTDNGAQYHTWRGKSAFAKECEKQGIKQIVSRPRHPQTLGKVERFWKTLWSECVQAAIFLDMEDARRRIGYYIDHYNFQRPHQGIEGLVPADRFFGAAEEVKETLKKRVAQNSLEVARQGRAKQPFYLTGVIGGEPVSVHQEGERYMMTRQGRESVEVDVQVPGSGGQSPEEPLPGESPLDKGLKKIDSMLKEEYTKAQEAPDEKA